MVTNLTRATMYIPRWILHYYSTNSIVHSHVNHYRKYTDQEPWKGYSWYTKSQSHIPEIHFYDEGSRPYQVHSSMWPFLLNLLDSWSIALQYHIMVTLLHAPLTKMIYMSSFHSLMTNMGTLQSRTIPLQDIIIAPHC